MNDDTVMFTPEGMVLHSRVSAPRMAITPTTETKPMYSVPTLKRVGAQTVFQEAREQIDAWEKANPRAEHIVLVLDDASELYYTCAGGEMKPSAVAGLLFAAAQDIVA